MADYIWVKNPRALPAVEQLTISMFVYTCACRCFNSDTSKGARGFFWSSVVAIHAGSPL